MLVVKLSHQFIKVIENTNNPITSFKPIWVFYRLHRYFSKFSKLISTKLTPVFKITLHQSEIKVKLVKKESVFVQ